MSNRGRSREVGSYHAQRGWFYSGIRKVVRKWVPTLDAEIILQTFDDVQYTMEQADGKMQVEVHGVEHRRFLCELMTALDELHDPENESGWVIRLFGKSKCPPGLSACEIIDLRSLSRKLFSATTPLAGYLKRQLSKAAVNALASSLRQKPSDVDLKRRILGGLVTDLNRIISGGCLHEKSRFANIGLRPVSVSLLKTMRSREFAFRRLHQLEKEGMSSEMISDLDAGEINASCVWLNRLLLEDAFPEEVAKMEPEPIVYPGRRPFTYPEMVIEIIARGGPLFTPGSLEKTSKRLKLTGGSAKKESAFHIDDYPQEGYLWVDLPF